jgi:hypothetical protein
MGRDVDSKASMDRAALARFSKDDLIALLPVQEARHAAELAAQDARHTAEMAALQACLSG